MVSKVKIKLQSKKKLTVLKNASLLCNKSIEM